MTISRFFSALLSCLTLALPAAAQAQLMLGYAGWGPGQLEGEIAQNGWLTCEASPEVIFDLPDPEKWGAALKTLGIDPLGLSASAGHA